MSEFKVPYTTILDIKPHNNAERLEVATIYGFQVIVGKGRYKIGDNVVYIPVDSILPQELEAKLFPEGSKIQLHNHRVRQIRIRGLASQGMTVDPSFLTYKFHHGLDESLLEVDLAEDLGITKYEPPQPGFAQTLGSGKNRNKKSDHPMFHKYNGLNNIKWFPDLFKEGEEVVIQEKLHGTNARASLLPFIANTFWKKVKAFLKLAPQYEKCYGSNNVEISAKTSYKGFYGQDIYGTTFQKLQVFSKLAPGETVFGEIIGPSIQKNYTYGLEEPQFVLFDVKILNEDGTQTWLTPQKVEEYASVRGFKYVPVLFKGHFQKEQAYALTKGNSEFCTNQKVREGIVIKAQNDYSIDGNKKAVKWVSEEYLNDQSNTDFH